MAICIHQNVFGNLNRASVRSGFGAPMPNDMCCVVEWGSRTLHDSLTESDSDTRRITSDKANSCSHCLADYRAGVIWTGECVFLRGTTGRAQDKHEYR